ncbi:MAG: dienelactone hydrolase family protein [Thiobacillaceae bacterium]|nr:dienelactone hydrolase family protein [Thiobacillaceae bacterium]MCX7672974.1 dienelactone hydrolase family protein [Thiobacillaceae bacterium]MDW8324523.1 dienelactone hydrolase family protein [Burkholderiales bacterium]
MRSWIGFFVLVLTLGAARAEVRTEEVTYSDGQVTMKGYLAYDDAIRGKRPGVLVVHEWWGLNDYARSRARRLAAMGYTALAVDMYGDGRTAAHPKEAGAFAGEVRRNLPLARSRFEAALRVLRQHPTVAAEDVAALGYCFGGSVVLEMARQGLDLDAVVSYHGSLQLSTPAEPGRVKARVAVFTGEADPMIPPTQVEAFRQEMQRAGVDLILVSYPGVTHSFTNPEADRLAAQFGLPLAYDRKADEDSWARTSDLLRQVFGR